MKFSPNCVSRLFQPLIVVPKNAEIKHNVLPVSQKHLIDLGFIRQSSNGIFNFLPLGLRVINKLIHIIDINLKCIGAQKLQLSCMTDGTLWKKSSRWDAQVDAFKFKDRHGKDFLLGPTHEESISQLLASIPSLSYKQLPILLYQISSKFRDEIRPRCGLIRSREFIMKDLYTFDESTLAAEATYSVVTDIYNKILEYIGIPFIRAESSNGTMGGDMSHEFHYQTDVGEDIVKVCADCSYAANIEVSNSSECPKCGSSSYSEEMCIEVGHTFLLGSHYSEALGAMFTSRSGSKEPLMMSSYGLGLSRIMASTAQVLSTSDSLRWPDCLAPFSVAIIPPKNGSKEEALVTDLVTDVYCTLERCGFSDDVLLDERGDLTIGRRLAECQRIGYPYVIVVGRKAVGPGAVLELHLTNQNTSLLLPKHELIEFFNEKRSILAN